MKMKDFKPAHFNWRVEGKVAVITLTRPERKNPITFESYAELRDTFRKLVDADDINAVVFGSNGGNFCSGGDVHDIIGPLLDKDMKGLLAFTRMTGDLMKAIRACPQPIIALTRSPVMRVKFSRPFMSRPTSGPMMSCTSPPEQKLPPFEAKTTTSTSLA